MDIRDIKEECNLLIDEVVRLQKIDRDLDMEISILQGKIGKQNICSMIAGDEADFHEESKLPEPESTKTPKPREKPVTQECMEENAAEAFSVRQEASGLPPGEQMLQAEEIFLPNENENKGRGIILVVVVATVLLLCYMGKGVI